MLVHFVTLVNQHIRPGDFLFRIGGEEFYCLLPNTSAEEAVAVAERVRRQFEAATLEIGGTRVKATVSIGVAATETFGYDADVLVRQADAATYAAKRQGRNKVVFAQLEDALARGARVMLPEADAVPAT